MNDLNPGPQRRVSRELAWASLFLLFTFVSRAEPSLALSPASGSPGETVSIPLSLENSAGSQLGGLMWTLNYPTSSVLAINATAGSALTGASKSLTCTAGSGSFSCVATGVNQNILTDGVIADVQLSLAAGATSGTLAFSLAAGSSVDGSAVGVTSGSASLTVSSPLSVSGLSCSPTSLSPQQTTTCTLSLSRERARRRAASLHRNGRRG